MKAGNCPQGVDTLTATSLPSLWTCYRCGRQVDAPSAPWWCGCNGVATYVRASRRPSGELMQAAARPRSAADLCREAFDMRLCPATGLVYCFPAVALLYGAPGAGKSCGALQIAGATGLPVTVAAFEVQPGPALAYQLRAAGLQNRTNVTVSPAPSVGELVAAASKHEVIVVDSVGSTQMQPSDVRGLTLAGSSLVLAILHSTKAGGYRGATSWAHEADLLIEVEPGGRWTCQKSRFGPTGDSGTFRGVARDDEVSP